MKSGFLDRVVDWVDRLSEWTGMAVMWLTTGMMLLTVYNVFDRYFLNPFVDRNVFNIGTAVSELNMHFFSLVFLFGAAYTLKTDGHVRVDLAYYRLGERGRAVVNLIGCTLFLVPFCAVLIYASLGSRRGFDFSFVGFAWQRMEGSGEPGGLPTIFLLKTALPVGIALLLVQGLGELLRNALVLARWEKRA